MHPILFEFGGLIVYSYGFMIAVGAVAGVSYMAIQGKKEAGLTFDKANSLFLLIFFAALVGGKAFLFLEDPSTYIDKPSRLFTGTGFVFYGSFLLAVPAMLWFFRKNNLHTFKMLDVMAITTCLVHMFGRIGCFLAGCCYGTPTDSVFGVVYTHPACYAEPKNTPLHPTQLYEAFYIFVVMLVLVIVRDRRKFYGQLFLLYLGLYATGRLVIELFRGDEERGYIFSIISHSQLIALFILSAVALVYVQWSKRNIIRLKSQKREL